jgi:hypothetical protein
VLVLIAFGVLALSPAAFAGSAPQLGAANSPSLKWHTHRTIAKKAVSHAKHSADGSQASAGGSTQKQRSAPRRVAPAAWQASGTAARAQYVESTGPDLVVQASGDKANSTTDPFGDDPLDTSDAQSTQTSQPESTDPLGTAPDSLGASDSQPGIDALGVPESAPAAEEPSRLRNDSDPFPEERVPEPFVDTLPENQSVVDGTAPGDFSCDSYKKECDEQIQQLRSHDITKIILGVVIEGTDGAAPVEGKDFPCECKLGLNARFEGRNWAPTTFTWKATGTCFKPLYFQDVQLERYGHSWNPVVQPFASAAHFFISVPLLPYKMGLNQPNECVYTLGYYRPGSCAPYMIEPIPLSMRAMAYEALGATAFAFWFWPPPTGP